MHTIVGSVLDLADLVGFVGIWKYRLFRVRVFCVGVDLGIFFVEMEE
jgi:hypothetical protein